MVLISSIFDNIFKFDHDLTLLKFDFLYAHLARHIEKANYGHYLVIFVQNGSSMDLKCIIIFYDEQGRISITITICLIILIFLFQKQSET